MPAAPVRDMPDGQPCYPTTTSERALISSLFFVTAGEEKGSYRRAVQFNMGDEEAASNQTTLQRPRWKTWAKNTVLGVFSIVLLGGVITIDVGYINELQQW